ncbi:MAG: N-acetylglucosamine-6-phosphate deacetylase [Pseudomonadota bacterium]|jgi:N-acetylglucosamine-6-phosphate deacetylase
MTKLHGNILIEGEFYEAEIEFSEKIQTLVKKGKPQSQLPSIIPGFIDLHVHGGGGADIMEGGIAAAAVTKTHAMFGTTSLLATTMTAPFAELEAAFLALKPFYLEKSPQGSRILGVHLEGPYISHQKLGAQPDFVRKAALDEIRLLNDIVPIKVITLAPEAFENIDLISYINSLGMIVQIGHTNGTYEQGVAALKKGAKGFTHLFNAMSGFHHREPGMVGAALAHGDFAELIPDLLHVHQGAIKTALRSIPNLYFVTDATAAAGMPDGAYQLGAQTVYKCLGGVRLDDGTLAGSALTMEQALRNLVELGLKVEEVSHRLSGVPAQFLQLKDRGLIREGFFADLLVLRKDLTVENIYSEGVLV